MAVNTPITERMISDFCRKRIAPHLPPVHTEALRKFLIGSVDAGVGIPRYAGKYDWTAIGMLTNVPEELLVGAGRHIVPLLDAIGRSIVRSPKRPAFETAPPPQQVPVRGERTSKRNLDVTDRAARVLSGTMMPDPAPQKPMTIPRPKRWPDPIGWSDFSLNAWPAFRPSSGQMMALTRMLARAR